MKKFFVVLLLVALSFSLVQLKAYDLKKNDKIYVCGSTVGLKLNTGITVMGTYGVNENGEVKTPWSEASIEEGDIILSLNNISVSDVKSLLRVLSNCTGESIPIQFSRKNKIYESHITPALKDEKSFSLGLYIKDHILGIGTLTYIIPQTNLFGSLGHSITSINTSGGEIYEASVDAIKKPSKNEAGEKRATISGESIGNIDINSDTGIHGVMDSNYETKDFILMNVKTRDEVKLGKAQILTVIENDKIEAFDIMITELSKQKNKAIKGIKFKVTDETLLKKTGGIVQGMSGSPIIQDNCIIGAVTHVLLSDATSAYGIYIEFMLSEMNVNIVD